MFHVLKGFALVGGEWVLYLLVALSVWSVAVMAERFLYFRKRLKGSDEMNTRVGELLSEGDAAKVKALADRCACPESVVLLTGLERKGLEPGALEQVMESARIREKLALERNLLVLGTLGNNAPFIGLFGTVLGIIKAFNDLAVMGTSGPAIVMNGIAEALVATAVGLLIAIPAVAAYNYFQGEIRKCMSNADRVARLVLAHRKK
jgi:biopolymer transport protein ExbB/TolQ